MHSGYWQELTTVDFDTLDAERTVALLPVAAIEQHGPHLPLATDAVINDGIVRAALPRIDASAATLLVLPALRVGTSTEHESFPGTLSIPPTMLADVWTEVGRGVARAGVRKLVIFNTHGGQKSVVDIAALRLRAERRMLVVRASYFAFGAPPGLYDAAESTHDIHGGEVETSLMLHLRPDLVRLDRAENFRGLPHELAERNRMLGAEKPVGFGWLAEDLHPAGVCGNAANADAERGEAHLAHLAIRLAALVGEVAATPLTVLRSRTGP